MALIPTVRNKQLICARTDFAPSARGTKGCERMKKRFFSVISFVISILLLVCASAVVSHAETLYTDGDYTFADSGEDFVKLYGYTGDSAVLTIPNHYNNREVIGVCDFAFYKNTAIEQIDFSETSFRFTGVGMKAFAESGLSGKLTLPASIRSLGYGCFQDNSGISSVEFLSLMKDIPEQCFYSCSSLQEVILPINAETIGTRAFADCPSLYDVYFPRSVNTISSSAFNNTPFVCFHVYYGSYAHQFAIENRISYTLRDGVKLGDVNGDGSVNINDVTTIQRTLADLESLEGIYLYAADTNRDTMVDISDATAVQMFLAEYDIPYSIGQVLTR